MMFRHSSKTYYAPNNAALRNRREYFAPADAKALEEVLQQHPVDESEPPPADLTEPPQEKEKHVSREDKLAQRPALAFAYHMPDRGTPEYYAMGLLDELLLQGDDSLLRQELVKTRLYRQRGRRYQSAREYVQLQRADALDGLFIPRFKHNRGADHERNGN